MKIIQKISRTGIIFLASMLLFACGEEFLTQYPKDSLTAGTFYKTDADFDAAANGVYDALNKAYSSEFVPFFDMMTPFIDNGGGRFDVYKIYGTNGVINTNDTWSMSFEWWQTYYRCIGRANTVLSSVDTKDSKVTAEVRERVRGEALFLRAYSYFNLVNLFGDVPLITKPQTFEELLVPRTPKAEVVAQIIKDLTAAQAGLPSVSKYRGTKNIGRVSKGAALALLGKVYLYQQDWANAELWLSKVIDSKDYELIPYYVDMFWPTGENGKESIFEIQYGKSDVGGADDRNRYPLYAGFDIASNTYWVEGFNYEQPNEYYCDQFETVNGYKVQSNFAKRNTTSRGYFNFDYNFVTADPAFNPAKPYEIRDPRLKWTVWYENTPYITEDFMKRSNMTGTNFKADYSKRTNHCTVKYITGKASPYDDSEMNMIVIRYADVLLMNAEAKLEQSKLSEAVELINQVRKRPSVNMPTVQEVGIKQGINIAGNQANLRQYLREERYRELGCEWGHLYFDQIRWKIFDDEMVKYWTANKEGYTHPAFVWDEKWWLWPIPSAERQKNPNLTQNTGY